MSILNQRHYGRRRARRDPDKIRKLDRWIIPLNFFHKSLYSYLSTERSEFHCDGIIIAGLSTYKEVGINTDNVNLFLNPEAYEVCCENNFTSLYWSAPPISCVNQQGGETMAECFKVSKVSSLKDFKEGDLISPSDLAIQVDDKLIQFAFLQDKSKKVRTIIKPGTWTLASTSSGLKLEPVAIAKKRLLLDVTNTSTILNEAKCFFSNLDVYRELERPLKRGVLLYSQPGLGKSATIGHFCDIACKEDPGTVVVIWPTAKIEAYQFEEFLSTESEYHESVSRVILVLEDIGGGEVECGRRAVDSSLLNLLDGVTVTFSLPTFIIATTNHPDNLLKSLADRPGRFDLMQELLPPKAEERIKLLEFIAKRELTQEEKDAVSVKEADTLSIAHLDEIVVRSRIHNKTMIQTLKEIMEHRKFMNKNFDRTERTLGLGIDDE